MENYFDLLSLSIDFAIDKLILEKNYQDLIIQHHPDKFANKSSQDQTLAQQNTSLLNTAYQTLKNDLKRANYLLELAGINAFDEKDTQMDASFLMAQIEFREALEVLEQKQDVDKLEDFVEQMRDLEKHHITNIAASFNNNELKQVKIFVRELKFYQQLKQQANQLVDELL